MDAWTWGIGTPLLHQYVKCIEEIKTNLLSFLFLAQFIVGTKVPTWVGLAKKGVLKGWVGLGTCILKRVC